jgi:MSHA biogenesis protein MshG
MKALEGLEKTTDNEKLENIIRGLRESLDEGLDLTGAMKKQPHIFSDLYTNLIHIGETTGKLPEIFEELSRYLQKEKETREKVKSALTYPTTVVAVIGIGLIVVNVFVLPAFAEMFQSFNAELPLPTRILIGFSEFTSKYSYTVVGFFIALILAVRHYLTTSKGKMWWHETQYKLPLFGRLLLQNSTSRFARTMSITSHAGVPMEQALQIIAPAIGNVYMEKKIQRMRASVERGESITNSVIKAGMFPGLVVQMISVGEEAGTLDEMVAEIAEYYDREIDQTVKALTAAIEPVVIGFIAVIVLILALGIFLPMISLMGAMN